MVSEENVTGEAWCHITLLAVLFAQELEDGGEVLAGVAAGAHHSVHLMSQRAQRDGGLGVRRSVLGQAQVL